MIFLVDTCVWIRHLSSSNTELQDLLNHRQVLTHSGVIGELACGSIPGRNEFLSDLGSLQKVAEATSEECLRFIERHRLAGKGLGWVDVQLLASAALSRAKVLTTDKILHRVALQLHVA